jgi:RNAse (barnase) inhibitor barstar
MSNRILEIIDRPHLVIDSDKLIVIDCQMCRSLHQTFDTISRSFSFPFEIGHNYNALHETLSDLSWLEFDALSVFFLNAESLMCEEDEDALDGLLYTFWITGEAWAEPISLGEWWDRPAKSFRIFLHKNPASGLRITEAVGRCPVQPK